MKILILGATGLIGSAIARTAVAQQHTVTGLARTPAACTELQSKGITPLLGDLHDPATWIDALQTHDTLIHCAAAWDADDMGKIDLRLSEMIIASAKHRARPLRMLYTGGCWLYGQTGATVATETSPRPGFSPFNWMITSAEKLLHATNLNTAIIHPAMVYDGSHGAMARYHAAAAQGKAIEIWGSAQTRWPLIHAEDLGRAYLHVAAMSGQTGHFNASTESGLTAHQIATKIAQNASSTAPYQVVSAQSVIQCHGDWAAGPMLDQQMASPRLRSLGWVPQHSFT